MSSEDTPNVPATTEEVSVREAVREKAQQVRAQQTRRRLMRRTAITVGAMVVVGAAVFGVYKAIDSRAAEPVRYPTGMTADGVKVDAAAGITQTAEVVTPLEEPDPTPTPTASAEPAGDEGEPVEFDTQSTVDIHIYVDYLSPGAGDFERANARQLSGWISEGAVAVTYHPVALLTASSNGTKYSQRAAGAAACVATHSPEQFYSFNHDLLVQQPTVDSDGFTDIELAELAIAVGVDNSRLVRSCIEERRFMGWAKEATARALEGPLPGSKDLVLGTPPMVVVNGQAYIGALDNPAEFSQFVLTVASDTYYSSTPTPAPSESTASED